MTTVGIAIRQVKAQYDLCSLWSNEDVLRAGLIKVLTGSIDSLMLMVGFGQGTVIVGPTSDYGAPWGKTYQELFRETTGM